MKKRLAMPFIFLLVTLISMSTLGSVQAYVSSHNWIGPSHRGYDYFYGTSVVAYEAGSDATLIVSVYNSWGVPLNVSAVRVGFDWGINYSSTEYSENAPVQIPSYQSRVLTAVFQVPGTTVASNLVTHSYTIYVEHVNSTTGPKRVMLYDTDHGGSFVVYSGNQAECNMFRKQLEAWDYAYFNPIYLPSEAKDLWIQAYVEENMADDAYDYGNFASARTHYGNAVNLTRQALSSEVDSLSDFEDALLGLTDSAGSYLSSQGTGFMIIGVGFGIGFLLMGIGAAVYLIRKSGTPSAKA